MVVPPKHPKMIIFSRKTLVVGYHHFRKLPFGWSSISCVTCYPMCLASTSVAAFRSTRLRVALVSAKWTHSALIHKKAGNWWHRSGEKFVEDCRGKIGATAISNLETWAGEEHILRSYANGPWALHGLPCWDISKSVRPFNGAKPPHRLPIRNDNGTKMPWLYYLKTSVILLMLETCR